MFRYLCRRLGQTIIVIIAVSILSFLLVYLTGDPAAAMLPLSATEKEAEALREHFGLNKPLYVQYFLFVKNALHGDLGNSFRFRTPAVKLVLQRLPATLSLALISTILGSIIGIPLAIFSAMHKNTFWDYLTTALSFFAISTPNFWLGIILVLVFAQNLMWLPPSGREGPLSYIMPSVTMAVSLAGTITRLLRRELIDVMNEDYIDTAKSKGLKDSVIFFVHALKNAIIPTVTVIGLNFGSMLGGSVIIESIFAWPGVGWLLNQAIGFHDLPIIRAGVLILALFITLTNLLVDISYGILDPRIRITGNK